MQIEPLASARRTIRLITSSSLNGDFDVGTLAPLVLPACMVRHSIMLPRLVPGALNHISRAILNVLHPRLSPRVYFGGKPLECFGSKFAEQPESGWSPRSLPGIPSLRATSLVLSREQHISPSPCVNATAAAALGRLPTASVPCASDVHGD